MPTNAIVNIIEDTPNDPLGSICARVFREGGYSFSVAQVKLDLLYGDNWGTKMYHKYYNLPYDGMVGITKKRGAIRANYIIHARIDTFKNANESIDHLKYVLAQIFKCAEDKNLRQIAIPAICDYRGFSSGYFMGALYESI